ncbi:hypothetical protein UlMin_014378 [Ulmus minor]
MSRGCCTSRDTKWTPPVVGHLKINVDALMNRLSGACGLSIIARDYLGEVKFAKSIFWPMPICIVAAEALAIKFGMITAIEEDVVIFSITSNSSLVVAAINSKKRILNDFGVIVDEIRDLAASYCTDGFEFTPRSANNPADCLAKWPMSNSMSFFWKDDFPSSVCLAIEANKPLLSL